MSILFKADSHFQCSIVGPYPIMLKQNTKLLTSYSLCMFCSAYITHYIIFHLYSSPLNWYEHEAFASYVNVFSTKCSPKILKQPLLLPLIIYSLPQYYQAHKAKSRIHRVYNTTLPPVKTFLEAL